ncbi:MAG: glycosyltransferase family 4 protein [Terriglobales bacterium]
MRITIFTSVDGNYSIDRYAQELSESFPSNVEIKKLGLEKRPGLRGRILDKHLKYLRLARREQGDWNIIVSETYSFLLLAVEGSRSLVVCHDVHPLIENKKRGVLRSLLRGELRRLIYVAAYRVNLRLMRRARRIVTVSRHTREDLLRFCPFLSPDKVVAVHSGVSGNWAVIRDSTRLAELRSARGLEGKKVILHVGNDSWYKNFQGLLRAFALLKGEDLVLVKAGDISRENRWLIQELGIAGRVVHIQGAKPEELVALYNIAEMLAFPSLHEGFGWPPLEAMACGCPVLTTRRASLPEVCGDSCLCVEPEDIPEMAAAMSRLMNTPALRDELVRKGFEQVKQFPWQKTAEGILSLL